MENLLLKANVKVRAQVVCSTVADKTKSSWHCEAI